MTVVARNKVDLVVPPSVRRRAGIKNGDRLEFKVSGGVISIVPKPPAADDEYTSAQRRVIDARLVEAQHDVDRGRTHGPFKTHEEMMSFLKNDLRQHRRASKRDRTPK